MIQQSEESEQAALFEWAAYESGKWPELALMFHVPNGGYRDKATAARLKACGVKPGVPDIFLPAPRNGSAGLFIEMKVGTNRPTKEQLWYLDELCHQGYAVAVCYGFQNAIETITKYLREPAKQMRRSGAAVRAESETRKL